MFVYLFSWQCHFWPWSFFDKNKQIEISFCYFVVVYLFKKYIIDNFEFIMELKFEISAATYRSSIDHMVKATQRIKLNNGWKTVYGNSISITFSDELMFVRVR